MMLRLNYILNLINLFLILMYFIFFNINILKKQFEYLLISLIIINLVTKLYNWYVFKISKKQDLNIILNNIFFNNNFTKLSILILSSVTTIYMILQKDSLVINNFIEKLSFLLVFVFSLVGFCLEYFIFKSEQEK